MKAIAILATGLVFATAVSVTAPARAGPCTDDIYRQQVAFDRRLNTAAATGPTGAQTADATLHRQPTPNTVAQAEEKLGDISEDAAHAFGEAMRRARAADAAGDKTGCETALADGRTAIAK